MTPEEYCQQKAASSGSSFYYSFMFLPPNRRRAITALYAFCREVDDVVDECQDLQIASTKLAWWQGEVTRAYAFLLALRDYLARLAWRREGGRPGTAAGERAVGLRQLYDRARDPLQHRAEPLASRDADR